MAVENITLNIIPTGDTPSIHAAQYDVDRPFTITLKEGADDFTPTGYDIELQVRKVDSNIVTAIPTLTSGNVVTFNTTEQMTACSGTNLAELELTKDGQSFATLHFYLVVQRDVLAGGLTSQSEIYDLEEQIAAIVPEVIGDEYYTAEEVDEKIAEIPTFDPTNYYTKSQLYTKTETNGLLAQKANTSSLATVATSGSYNDLTNKPTIPDVSNYYTKSETYNQTEVNNLLSTKADTSSLATVATTGDYDDLINKPSLSTVATSGSYNDLTDKPTIPTNAEQLPIESGSATNTKDYIDSKFTYSTTEKVVGEWIDGSTIYQKTIDLGILPDTASTNIPHNISNLKYVIGFEGVAYMTNTVYIPLPFVSDSPIYVAVSTTNVTITTTSNRSTTQGYITMRYIKN